MQPSIQAQDLSTGFFDFDWLSAALVIAIVGAVIALIEVHLNRRHNRLSVKPILVFYRGNDETEGAIRHTLSNKGMGPAVITKRQLLLDGAPIDWPVTHTEDRELLERLGLTKPNKYHFNKLRIGTAISERDTTDVFYLATQCSIPERNEAHEQNVAALKRLNIKLTYASIYGETWTVEMADAYSFGTNDSA